MDPDLRKIQLDELIVYDVELSEYISRKMNRIQAEKIDAVLTESDIQKIYQSFASGLYDFPFSPEEERVNSHAVRFLSSI